MQTLPSSVDLVEPALALCRAGAGQHSLRAALGRAAPSQASYLNSKDIVHSRGLRHQATGKLLGYLYIR